MALQRLDDRKGIRRQGVRPRYSQIFERDKHDHYVEPLWVSERLFETEEFEGPVLDPAMGWGRILWSASAKGFRVMGSDIVDRRIAETPDVIEFSQYDFTGLNMEACRWWMQAGAIVCNPPFDQIEGFAARALALMADEESKIGKVAFICPLRRLPAAHGWLEQSPLVKMLMMSPRPSMPAGDYIMKGGKVGGGTQDFVWLIWEKGYVGRSEIGWLHREATEGKVC